MDWSTEELLQEALEDELSEHGTLLPPWVKFPRIPPFSVGWRRGDGEWFMMVWARWLESLEPAERLAYFRAHAPIPLDWQHFVAEALFPEDEDDLDRAMSRLAEAGLADLPRWRAFWEDEDL